MGLPWKRRQPPQDPWREALGRHVAGEPTEPLPQADAPAPRGRRRLIVGLLAGSAAIIVALLAGGGYLGYLASENHDRADDWRDRSTALEGLVADRTKALNRQTARLNVASTRLRQAGRAVARSEQDVEQLEVRQRELAAEKAQVEDERAALVLQRADLAGIANQLSGLLVRLFGCCTAAPLLYISVLFAFSHFRMAADARWRWLIWRA